MSAGHHHGTKDISLRGRSRIIVTVFLSVAGVLSLAYSVFVWFHSDVDLSPRHQPDQVAYGTMMETPPGCGHDYGTTAPGADHTHPQGCSRYGAFVKLESGDTVDVAVRGAAHADPGDRVQVGWFDGAEAPYVMELDRSIPLVALVVLFILASVAVAKWTGIRAVLGLGATFAIMMGVVIPAILSGLPAIPSTIAGITLILFVVMYSTHGISWMTSSAMTGTVVSMLVSAAIGYLAIWSLRIGSVIDHGETFATTLPNLKIDTFGVMLAGFIAGSVGALNDVTITQASSAWEMRDRGRVKAFQSAMKVGRDHIASSIYTVAFAYMGASIPTLMLLVGLSNDLRGVMTYDTMVVEIARAAVAGIAIAISVPITTALVVSLMEVHSVNESAPSVDR